MALVFSMVSQSDDLSLRLTCARRAQQIARGAFLPEPLMFAAASAVTATPWSTPLSRQLHCRSVDERWTMDEASLPLRALTAPYALS